MSDSLVWYLSTFFHVSLGSIFANQVDVRSCSVFNEEVYERFLFRLLGRTRYECIASSFALSPQSMLVSYFVTRTEIQSPEWTLLRVGNESIARSHDVCYEYWISRMCRPWSWGCSFVLWCGRHVVPCLRDGLNHCLSVISMNQQCWEHLTQTSPFIHNFIILCPSSPW